MFRNPRSYTKNFQNQGQHHECPRYTFSFHPFSPTWLASVDGCDEGWTCHQRWLDTSSGWIFCTAVFLVLALGGVAAAALRALVTTTRRASPVSRTDPQMLLTSLGASFGTSAGSVPPSGATRGRARGGRSARAAAADGGNAPNQDKKKTPPKTVPAGNNPNNPHHIRPDPIRPGRVEMTRERDETADESTRRGSDVHGVRVWVLGWTMMAPARARALCSLPSRLSTACIVYPIRPTHRSTTRETNEGDAAVCLVMRARRVAKMDGGLDP